MHERNWSGTYTYRAKSLHRPATVTELQEIVARAPRVRALGSRHSFNDIADSEELVSLDALAAEIVIDDAASTVSCPAAIRYGELARVLDERGLALANLASLPHISVAGAVATATHGSGERNGNLATAVAGITLVTSGGELIEVARGDDRFAGMVVGLGALGIVTRLTLDVEPAFDVTQHVFERLPWDELSNLDAIMSAGYSVSVFTHLGEVAEQVWVKRRIDAGEEPLGDELFGARVATGQRHMIATMDPAFTTAQLGAPGPWLGRLPHFRMEFTPSSGEELQSEFLVPRRHALPALDAVRGLAGVIQPLLQVCEIRAIAADELWMSTAYGESSLAIHFTWIPDEPAVRSALVRIEEALEPFNARPHWGKVFLMEAGAIERRYPRLGDFRELCERLDPRGAFRNSWLERHVLGAGG